MAASKPFLALVAVALIAGAWAATSAPHAQAAPAGGPDAPLSTRLSPAMIDYFALQAAFDAPNMAALAQCARTPACAASDSVQVQLTDGSGQPLAAYAGAPGTVITRVRTVRDSTADGATEQRREVRRYLQEDRARVVMSGSDSIVTVRAAAAGREASTVVRVHRYTDLRFVMNDVHLPWPLTGLISLQLSSTPGTSPAVLLPVQPHAAVSFDGTPVATILTSSALTHHVDLRARKLETVIPER